MTPNEQKAAREKVFSALNGGCGVFTTQYVFEKFSVAGLIVTDLHERALEACERMVTPGTEYVAAVFDAQTVGRESLAAKKPKERWTVDKSAIGWRVLEADRDQWSLAGRRLVAEFCHEPEARAYVAHKNAEGK